MELCIIFLLILATILVSASLKGFSGKATESAALVNAEMERIGNGAGVGTGELAETDAVGAGTAAATEGSSTQDEKSDEETQAELRQATNDTRDRMMGALRGIGCQPEIMENDSVLVSYQGEKFVIDFNGYFANIWDLGWRGFNIIDPRLHEFREAVNRANYENGPTVVMTPPDSEGYIHLHSRLNLLMHPGIAPDEEEYVKVSLNDFFRVKEFVNLCFNSFLAARQEAHRQRRPVGFTAPDDDTPAAETPANGMAEGTRAAG